MRLLDIGCGWGSMLIHAASEYGVTGVGITLSTDQAELARKRVAEAGLEDRVDIRLADYREVDDGPFDAISSIGMAEHVGRAQFLEYATRLHDLVRPGGRVLNHQISQRPQIPRERRTFVSEYVFPDGELLAMATVIGALEEADLEVRDVENLREHYPKTLHVWLRNLENDWESAVRLAGDGRARVWRLYLAISVLGFDLGRTRVNQVLAVRQHPDGRSDMPPTRAGILG
jgi:cyclopropane-fatty-acyl-phospholipid synthase